MTPRRSRLSFRLLFVALASLFVALAALFAVGLCLVLRSPGDGDFATFAGILLMWAGWWLAWVVWPPLRQAWREVRAERRTVVSEYDAFMALWDEEMAARKTVDCGRFATYPNDSYGHLHWEPCAPPTALAQGQEPEE